MLPAWLNSLTQNALWIKGLMGISLGTWFPLSAQLHPIPTLHTLGYESVIMGTYFNSKISIRRPQHPIPWVNRHPLLIPNRSTKPFLLSSWAQPTINHPTWYTTLNCPWNDLRTWHEKKQNPELKKQVYTQVLVRSPQTLPFVQFTITRHDNDTLDFRKTRDSLMGISGASVFVSSPADSQGIQPREKKWPWEQTWHLSGQMTAQQMKNGPWQWVGLGEIRWTGALGAAGKTSFSLDWRLYFSWWWTIDLGFKARDDYSKITFNWHPGKSKKIGFQGQLAFGTRLWPELIDPAGTPPRFPNLLAPGFFHLDAGFWWGRSEKWKFELGAIGGRLGIIALGGQWVGDPSWPTGFLPDQRWIWEQGARISFRSVWKKKKWQFSLESEARIAFLTLQKSIQAQSRWQWALGTHVKFHLQHQSRWDESIDEAWRHTTDTGFSLSW